MGWPKGKPRKGHVNKDGSTHKRWGSLNAAREAIRSMSESASKSIPTMKRKRGRTPTGGDSAWIKPEWRKLLRWSNGPWIEICPNCSFPEADGGYCVVCHWSRPIKEGRVT